MAKKTMIFKDGFTIKKAGDGSTVIEGWANKSVVDRGGDLINKDAWNLDNYKKSGIMLFNHDRDKPIGKMLDVRATDQGLWIKGQISKSADPFVSYIRDMVNEGILNAFSVGFDAKDEAKNQDGINEIKAAELYEVSVVTLPMNQDSLFGLSSKSLAGMEYKDVKRKVLRQKGAWLAATLQDSIYKILEAGKLDRADLEKNLADKAGIDAGQLSKILAGQVTPVPENVLAAFAEVLNLDAAALKKLDAGDVKVEANEPDAAADNADTPPPPPAPAKKDAAPAVGIIAIQIPKDAVDSADAAAAWAKDNGWAAEKVEETDNAYIVYQDDPSLYGDGTAMDLGDGVTALVGLKKSAEVDPSQGDQTTTDTPKPEVVDKKDACSDCIKKWVPQLISEGKDQDQAVAIAASKCGCSQKSAIPGGADGAPAVDQNPMYQQAQQTNVLLGAMIEVLKGISTKLDGLITEEGNEVPPAPAPDQTEPPVDAGIAKMLEVAKLRLDDIKQQLSRCI